MATLKYKDGNNWSKLDLGETRLDSWPIGSCYFGATTTSPASLIGGTWSQFQLFSSSTSTQQTIGTLIGYNNGYYAGQQLAQTSNKRYDFIACSEAFNTVGFTVLGLSLYRRTA